MSILNKVLFYLLIINSTSILIDSIFEKEKENMDKCYNAGPTGSDTNTIEKCLAVTPTLKGSESKCCMLTYKIDPLGRFKLLFGKNWKKQYMKLYELNEKQFENKINRIYGSANEINMCFSLIKNYKNVELYGISNSFKSFDGKIKYNCGDGEQIFDREKFNPSNEEEEMNKDLFDCYAEHEENNCINKSSKLLNGNSQCCWCKKTTVHDNTDKTPSYNSFSSDCDRFPIKELRNKLEEIIKEKKEEKYLMNCTCSDRKGKRTKINLDSFKKKIEIKN